MHYAFVTGSSRGLGKALAEQLLTSGDYHVYGFSRSNIIQNPNFTFVKMDFTNQESLLGVKFPKIQNPQSISLFNNAGMIEDIASVGQKSTQSIVDTYMVNAIAPSVLSNQFIKQFGSENCPKQIINISSGAGRHTRNAWADYCASKSAVDMHSQVVFDEQKLKRYPVKIVSIAPGVLDTNMQMSIRMANPKQFSSHQRFVKLKKEGKLDSPKRIAQKIIQLLPDIFKTKVVIVDIRDY